MKIHLNSFQISVPYFGLTKIGLIDYLWNVLFRTKSFYASWIIWDEDIIHTKWNNMQDRRFSTKASLLAAIALVGQLTFGALDNGTLLLHYTGFKSKWSLQNGIFFCRHGWVIESRLLCSLEKCILLACLKITVLCCPQAADSHTAAQPRLATSILIYFLFYF